MKLSLCFVLAAVLVLTAARPSLAQKITWAKDYPMKGVASKAIDVKANITLPAGWSYKDNPPKATIRAWEPGKAEKDKFNPVTISANTVETTVLVSKATTDYIVIVQVPVTNGTVTMVIQTFEGRVKSGPK